MMWFAVAALGLIACVAVFVLGGVVGIALECWLMKDTAPDLYQAYNERRRMKEVWKDGQSNH